MDKNKICFIICVNDDLFFQECTRYIHWLEVPAGMEVDLLEIRDASSMASGYNEGMNSSDAKYKVYMHQDCFIVNKYFIYDILSIFDSDRNIGMIGLNGTQKLPENGVIWAGERVPESYTLDNGWEGYRYGRESDGLWDVEGVDGVLMATQYDILWREDLFDGWDFYDLSHSFEMRRKGYRVVVPVHNRFWYQHDDKPVLSLWDYNKYRKRFIREYEGKSENEIQDNQKCMSLGEITVMAAADRNYLYPTMVLLTSLFYNHQNQKVTVYLLQIGFTADELEKIHIFAGQWKDKEINCIEIKKEKLGKLKSFGRYSVAAYFRILGMELLPDSIERVLYLDTDIVINGNLSELFYMEMGDAPIAGCYDINNHLQESIEGHKSILGMEKEYPYFNSGMLLINLPYVRAQGIAFQLLADIEKNFDRYSLVDQDALNKFFYKKMKWIPWQVYNCPCIPFISKERQPNGLKSLIIYREINQGNVDGKCYDITSQLVNNAVVLHFSTPKKPWKDREFYENDNMRDAMKIYRKYEELCLKYMDLGR